jgi:ribose transport system permease protein
MTGLSQQERLARPAPGGALRELPWRLRRHSGPLIALGLFAVLFGVFLSLHPRGLTVPVMTLVANQGVALAFAAAAQTMVVLIGGLDLSVGAVVALSNCVASVVVNGTPAQVALGCLLVLLTGAACGLLNGLISVYGGVQPIIATLATGAMYTGFAYLIRPIPGGAIDEAFAEALTYETFAVIPTSLLVLAAAVVVVWLPFRHSMLGRGCYAVGSSTTSAYMSGVPVDRSKLAAFVLAGVFASLGGLFLSLQTLSGDAQLGADYTLKSIAAVVIGGTSLLGGSGGIIGSIFGAYVLRIINSVLLFAGVSPLAQPLFEGLVLLAAISVGAVYVLRTKNRLDLMALQETLRPDGAPRQLIKGVDNAALVAAAAIVVIIAVGGSYLPAFLSVDYLVQQVYIAAFLGVVAAGAMVVILLGHIDLSIPWVMTTAAMVATGMVGIGEPWAAALAIPAGLVVGAAVGLINGIGVGYLRLPSMILTLAMNAVLLGLAVLYTGGFAPQTKAPEAMRVLGKGSAILGVPNMLWVWLLLSLAIVFLLRRTPFGRYLFAIGNRERATYMSGVNTSRVLVKAFVLSGTCSALAGVLLAGRLDQSYQGMGDEYLLPAIAAVVLGGTNILGGRGTYVGTVAGVLVITLLTSVLAVMQMPEASRRIIYGVVIIAMLLVNSRAGWQKG